MKYKVIEVGEKQTTSKGTDFWAVELEDENHVGKSVSSFKFKPEIGKTYDLKLTVSGDYTYMNVVKPFKKSFGGSGGGRPAGSYPDKEERLETRKSIESQAILKTIFSEIYTKDKKKEAIEDEITHWYIFLKDLIKR